MKSKPYLSIIVTSRNDNHGENMLHRFLHFFNGIIYQLQKYNLHSELIIVEWNPLQDKPKLHEVIPIPSKLDPVTIRFIEVSSKIHNMLQNPFDIPLFQMFGKNVGIRRSQGEYILATCNDIIFSDELIWFLSKKLLHKNAFYRCDRYELSVRLIPESLSYEEKFLFCSNNISCINGKNNCDGESLPAILNKNGSFFNFTNTELVDYIKLGKGLSIHTHAAGDFTLMAQEKWMAIDGYPEIPLGDLYIDGLVIYMAQAIGVEQYILAHPMLTYHIYHSMTTTTDLEERMKKRPCLDYHEEYLPWCLQMKEEQQPLNINKPDWGLQNFDLKETVFS